MTDLDDFLATTLARQLEAEEAIHNGDPVPRLAMWSAKDPVTVLGAARTATGWAEVSELFRWLGRTSRTAPPTAARMARGRSSTATPTPSRRARALSPRRRRGSLPEVRAAQAWGRSNQDW